MRGALTIECDMCLNSIEIPINSPATFHGMPKPSDIQHILTKNGWHALKSCLCPECKTKVKENNCMNCIHMQYKDFNYRCMKSLSEEHGIVKVDGSIVSEFDTCRDFKKNIW